MCPLHEKEEEAPRETWRRMEALLLLVCLSFCGPPVSYTTFHLRVGEQGLGLGIYDLVTRKSSKEKAIYLESSLTGAGLPFQRY